LLGIENLDIDDMPSIAEKLAANASPKCCICAKSVYKTEEVKALDKIWHKSCFTCSSSEKNGCGKVLNIMEGYQVHEERIPYCKNCYGKLYAPRGVNSTLAASGVEPRVYTSTGTGANDLTQKMSSVSVTSSPAVVDRRGSGSDRVAADLAAVKEAYSQQRKADVAATATNGGSSGTDAATSASAVPVNSVFASAISSAPAPAQTSKAAAMAAKFGSGASGTPKCFICQKTVYAREETKAMNRTYHSTCFTCGGTAGNGCKKTLKIMEGYLEHAAQDTDNVNTPYCKSCYNKNYAPKGVNAGLAATTDIGRITTTATTPVSEAPAPTTAPAAWRRESLRPTTTTQKEKDNVVPTPVVYASAVINQTAAAAPVRRSSGSGSGPAVGGNLKHAVHEEAAAKLDGDEVDEGEWD